MSFLNILLTLFCLSLLVLYTSYFLNWAVYLEFACTPNNTNHKVVEFNGERTVEGLSQFIDTQGQVGSSPKTEVGFYFSENGCSNTSKYVLCVLISG